MTLMRWPVCGRGLRGGRLFLAGVVWLAGVPARAEPLALPSAFSIEVEVRGVHPGGGPLVGKLFQPGDRVTGEGRWLAQAAGEEGATLHFAPMPPGRYAVVVFQDANRNGRIDHGWNGWPAEALGFSGGFRLSLWSGRPDFDGLAFDHGAEVTHLRVTLQ